MACLPWDAASTTRQIDLPLKPPTTERAISTALVWKICSVVAFSSKTLSARGTMGKDEGSSQAACSSGTRLSKAQGMRLLDKTSEATEGA